MDPAYEQYKAISQSILDKYNELHPNDDRSMGLWCDIDPSSDDEDNNESEAKSNR